MNLLSKLSFSEEFPETVMSTTPKILIAALGIFAVLWLWATPAHAAGSANNRAEQEVILAATPQQVMTAATQAFQQWNRGELVKVEAEQMQVKGISRTNFFKFVDDITVSVKPVTADPNQTKVSITSAGRMGEYDFGGNQRNIEQYLTTLRSLLSPS